MNKMLERAIACLIMEEMEAERGWDESFARSENKLAEMARRAKAQHARGETTPLVFPEKCTPSYSVPRLPKHG